MLFSTAPGAAIDLGDPPSVDNREPEGSHAGAEARPGPAGAALRR
jgi:hypothetical protein